MSISWKSWLPLKVYSTQESDSSACGNSCQSLLAVSFVNRRQLNKRQKNSCIPPRVGRHHHLREECEKREGENTTSGVQHAATGSAERPTHAAQSQLHTAADLRGEEKHRNRCTSARLEVLLPQFPACRNTEGVHTAECRMQQENAGKEPKSLCSALTQALGLLLCVWQLVHAHLAAGPSAKRPTPCRRIPNSSHTQAGGAVRAAWVSRCWEAFWPLCCWQESKLNCLHFSSQLFLCVWCRDH